MKIELISPTADKIDVLIDDHVAMSYVSIPTKYTFNARALIREQANAFALGARFGAAALAKKMNEHVHG